MKLSKNFNEVKCNKNKHDHFWHRVTKEDEQDLRKQIRGWKIFREDGLNLDKTLTISQDLADGKTIKEIGQRINASVKHVYSFIKENKIPINNSYIRCFKDD